MTGDKWVGVGAEFSLLEYSLLEDRGSKDSILLR